jgi:hypothetical protein
MKQFLLIIFLVMPLVLLMGQEQAKKQDKGAQRYSN